MKLEKILDEHYKELKGKLTQPARGGIVNFARSFNKHLEVK